jgi:hypothetical protein
MDEPVVSVGGGAFGLNLHLSPTALVDGLGAEIADVSISDQ